MPTVGKKQQLTKMASKKYVLQAAVLLLTGIQTLVSIFFTVKGLRAGDYINEVLGSKFGSL